MTKYVCSVHFGVYIFIFVSQNGIAINLIPANGFLYMLQCCFKWFVEEFAAVTITTNTLTGRKKCVYVLCISIIRLWLWSFRTWIEHESKYSTTFWNSAPHWKIHCIYQALIAYPYCTRDSQLIRINFGRDFHYLTCKRLLQLSWFQPKIMPSTIKKKNESSGCHLLFIQGHWMPTSFGIYISKIITCHFTMMFTCKKDWK